MWVAGLVTGWLLVFAAAALADASFSDAQGDNNAAPDATSVTVTESADGTITIALTVANYQALPPNSWINIWFDLDSNQRTGDAGDEALVRYVSDGTIDFFLWDGSALVSRPPAGMTGRFEAGVLTVTVPKSALGSPASFGLLAVTSRQQQLGEDEVTASDYAPDQGRSPFVSPAQLVVPDPQGDQDAAPDITGVKVSDTKDGWISFAISTPNYTTLPGDTVLLLGIDRDGRPSTGDDGAEVLVTNVGGEVILERWSAREKEWIEDDPPARVRARNAAGVVTIDVHRSELDDVARFGFSLISADINTLAESVLALDFMPDDQSFARYTLVNKAALRLISEQTFGTPSRPRAGKPFTITLPVRRSDTGREIASGTVTCNVTAGGKRVHAVGKVRAGGGQCSLVVPETAALVRGSLTVHSGGKSVSARFSFRVR